MNTTIELVWIDVTDVKTTYYNPDHEEEIVHAVSKAGKVMLPVTHASLHKGSMELLSQGVYFQVAKREGAEKNPSGVS